MFSNLLNDSQLRHHSIHFCIWIRHLAFAQASVVGLPQLLEQHIRPFSSTYRSLPSFLSSSLYCFLPIRPNIVEVLGFRLRVSPSLKPSGPSPITYLAFPVEIRKRYQDTLY